MHTFAGQRIEVNGQGSHQGLAFTGTHLGDAPFVQGHATDQLHIEVAHAHDSLARFAADGECFGEDLIEGFAFLETSLELFGLAAQLLVGERQHLLFEGIDGLHRLEHAFDLTLILASKEFLQ